MTSWKIFQGDPQKPHNNIQHLPDPPSWRKCNQEDRGGTYQARDEEIDLVNAALYLRRPLLVTGKPGIGKSSLAYAVAKELNLGNVLRWNITTRSTLQQGLYSYDAIGRLQDGQSAEKDNLAEIGKYIKLGSLGTALFDSQKNKPRVLLIDEIDKSDIDLPNDLLNIFEEGEFYIDELARIADKETLSEITVTSYDNKPAKITKGKIKCAEFPFVLLTSNGEREFPPAFLRRCLSLDLREPSREELEKIVKAHLQDQEIIQKSEKVIQEFVNLRDVGELATDQLLNAIYMLINTANFPDSPRFDADEEDEDGKTQLIKHLLKYLSSVDGV